MSSVVPTFTDLSFYSNLLSQTSRYRYAEEAFQKVYHQNPDFISRAPGRVNIIGDHIDYCHFAVLPMALDNDVIGLVGRRDDHNIVLHNTDPKFAPETVELPQNGDVVAIDQTKFTWVNYFKCGLIVAHKFILEKHPELVQNGKKPLAGLNLLFDGNVPTGGGLSSSAAFCVASTLAVLRGNGIESISKEDLTRITVVSEHYVGVNTGGMDQCASIYGEKRKALLIQFTPKLGGIPFELPVIKPNDMVFLIVNSLVESNKHETAPVNYNLRAVEVAIAAEYLAKLYGLKLAQNSNMGCGTLRGFLDKYNEEVLKQAPWDGNNIDVGIELLKEALKVTERAFPEDKNAGFLTQEAASFFEISEEDFHKRFLSRFPVRYEKLKLYQRTRHVFSDSLRVLEVLKLLQNVGNTEVDHRSFLRQFGTLMNESQDSCRDYNNASREELEELCTIARANGSYGSRVTGAGFGGSVVHLTTVDKLTQLRAALVEKYYKKHFPNITEAELEQAILDSKPATGSCIVKLG